MRRSARALRPSYTSTTPLAPVRGPAVKVSSTRRPSRSAPTRNHETTVTDTQFRQSGVTVAVSNPIVSAVQTAQQMAEAASNTQDGRMKALAAANTTMAAANAYVQYDIYHAQRTEGEIAATLAQHLSRIDHIQLADNPGRHEPGTGELNWAVLFAAIDRLGYRGWVSAEYFPTGMTADSLTFHSRPSRSAGPERLDEPT